MWRRWRRRTYRLSAQLSNWHWAKYNQIVTTVLQVVFGYGLHICRTWLEKGKLGWNYHALSMLTGSCTHRIFGLSMWRSHQIELKTLRSSFIWKIRERWRSWHPSGLGASFLLTMHDVMCDVAIVTIFGLVLLQHWRTGELQVLSTCCHSEKCKLSAVW